MLPLHTLKVVQLFDVFASSNACVSPWPLREVVLQLVLKLQPPDLNLLGLPSFPLPTILGCEVLPWMEGLSELPEVQP